MPDAVVTCQKAGICVRMVTGDNIHTARHIARECGLLTDDGIALEGPVFRAMPEEELIPILPKLQARAGNWVWGAVGLRVEGGGAAARPSRCPLPASAPRNSRGRTEGSCGFTLQLPSAPLLRPGRAV